MQLIKYFVIIIISSFAVAAACTFIADKGLKKSGMDFYGKMNANNNVTEKPDLLLIGSSRMLVHADPHIIDSITGLHSYNYGLNAGSIRTWYNIMGNALLQNDHAKAVVLNIDYRMFDSGADPYKVAYYYPFENKGIFSMEDSGKTAFIHRLRFLDISLYDDYAKYAAIDGLVRPGRIAGGTFKGFNPNYDTSHYEAIPGTKQVFESGESGIIYSEKGFALLDSCISLCRRKNVQLIFTIAPYFNDEYPGKYYSEFDTVIQRVKNTAGFNHVPFLDFTKMSIAGKKEYFYNVNHLNIKGAKIYSEALADSIANILHHSEVAGR